MKNEKLQLKIKNACYVGTSGYSYNHWKNGVFYPKGLVPNKWLECYSKIFNTVELNVTFYRLPKKEAFKTWYKKTPKDFYFAIKGSRFITHIKRLKDCREALKLFFNRIYFLKDKASCILWQLPPEFKCDKKRIEKFIKDLSASGGKKIRHVFEFRDESWYIKQIFHFLKDSNIALCIADWPLFSKKAPDTADFIYIRRHGTGASLYGGCYSIPQLKKDAGMIRNILKKNRDVYIYFNNDDHGYAPKNALSLKKMLKL